MKSELVGQDYFLFLEKNVELIKLKKEKLEAKLTEPFDGVDLGKLITLRYGENDGPDGIELIHLPKNARSWDEIKKIRVMINERAYNYIKERDSFVTRYNGSDKIQIYNGNPRLEF